MWLDENDYVRKFTEQELSPKVFYMSTRYCKIMNLVRDDKLIESLPFSHTIIYSYGFYNFAIAKLMIICFMNLLLYCQFLCIIKFYPLRTEEEHQTHQVTFSCTL